MTNKAQAKPTKDPHDPIQHRSLLTPAFICAALVVASLVWLVWDDFFATKPWKDYQIQSRHVRASFLQEKLYEQRVKQSTDGYGEDFRTRSRQEIEAGMAIVSERYDEMFLGLVEEIGEEIERIDTILMSIEADVGAKFWLKERRSILAEATFKKSHGDHSMPDDIYRAVSEEIRYRGELVTKHRLNKTIATNRLAEVAKAISALKAKEAKLTADVASSKKQLTAMLSAERDFIQIFKQHQGKNDIVDRCQTCHDGTLNATFDRQEMWGSHLSNHMVRGFFEEYKEKNFWAFKDTRLEQISQLAAVNGEFGEGENPNAFFKSEPDNLTGENASEYLAIANFTDVEALFAAKMDDPEVKKDVLFGWHRANRWRGNAMLDPEQVVDATVDSEGEEEGEDGDGTEESAVPAALMGDPELAEAIKEYGVFREEGPYLEKYDPGFSGDFPMTRENIENFGTDTPANLLAAEVWVYLASVGPFTLEGNFGYPDRYGFADKKWFLDIVEDERVQELYRMAYRKFSHYIKEKFLMFTAHPRINEHFGNHDSAKFGCTSCHRGTGINTKSVKSAHGYQHHWLMPLYQEGYQEAGCQKCHKAEIELENATRLQKGKDLYQQLGCWGCHNYEGYDAEGGEQIRTAKAVRDTTAEIERLRDSYAEVEAKILAADPNENSEEFERRVEKAVAELGVDEDRANEIVLGTMINDRMRYAEELASLQRQELALAQSLRGSHARMDELDIERKKRGPNLKDIAVKVPEEKMGWLANWIRAPKNFRPSTRMPHFFYGPFSFVDELRRDADGELVSEEDRAAAFDKVVDGMGNPLYRRHRKHDVDMIKKITRHIWQSSMVSKDLGDVKEVRGHGVPSDTDSVDAGRTIFATNCISCHSVEPDLVRGQTVLPMIDLAAEPHHDQLPITLEAVDELVAAPKYQYRVDGSIQKDGHGNPMMNEFIYSFAANLSRIGEKASADYLVEWVLQPRLRNKHAIMPSFWPSLAGTPEGLERNKLNATIAEFEAMSERTPVEQRLYVDAKRRRGDIDAASIQLYRDTIKNHAGAPIKGAGEGEANVDLSQGEGAEIILALRSALKAYDQAKKVVAYLMTLQHSDPAVANNLKSPESGYVGAYSYFERVWNKGENSGEDPTSGEDSPFAHNLDDNPSGEYSFEEVMVDGFGDFEFMTEGYEDYLRVRMTRRAAKTLGDLSGAINGLAADFIAADELKRDRAFAKFQNGMASFTAAYSQLSSNILGLDAREEELVFNRMDWNEEEQLRTQWERDQIKQGLAAAYTSFEASLERAAAIEEQGLENQTTYAAEIMATFVKVSDALKQIQVWATKYETFTLAGEGAAYTRQYGCAGCHEIEGLENEARIGVELTDEGSKFIQRLDFGLLESHQELDDHHTPRSPLWVSRGSLRAYDPAHIKAKNGEYKMRVPENLPYMRGGKGFELPEGVRQRYIHSKFHYRTRPAWFQGKLHNPRQWDKGRLLDADSSFFERTRMPLFELDEQELLAITTFIEGSETLKPWGEGSPELPRQEYIYNYKESADDPAIYDDKVKGWWIVKKYNCIGCHSVGQNEGRFRRLADPAFGMFGENRFATDGSDLKSLKLLPNLEKVPPALHDAGARVKGEWLIEWLRNPRHVRNTSFNANVQETLGLWHGGSYKQANADAPLVDDDGRRYFEHTASDMGEMADEARVRMPQFYLTVSEARQVQAFLSYIAKVPTLDTGKGERPNEASIEFGRKIFNAGGCKDCHGENDFKAGYYVPGGRAPNLRQVSTRLRRDWLRNWLLNPEAIQPGTAMPSFFRFDEAKQMHVLRDKPTGEGNIKFDQLGTPDANGDYFSKDHLEALIDWLMWGIEEDYTKSIR